ncbi:MAG TPA: sulfite exporter TauE/SafE family protein [Chloroflexota bacterium]
MHPLMVEESIATTLIVLGAAIAAGATGFAFGLFSTPLLTLFLDVRSAVTIALTLGAATKVAMLVSPSVRKNVDWRLCLTLVAMGVLGLPVGTYLLAVADQRSLKLAISLVTLAFALLSILDVSRHVHPGRLGAVVAGFLSGVLSSSTSLSGPPIVLYLANRRLPKEVFRASLNTHSFFLQAASMSLLASVGLAERERLVHALGLLPPTLLGLLIGARLFHRLSGEQYRAGVLWLLVAVALLGGWAALR